jgi:hypothetical protein
VHAVPGVIETGASLGLADAGGLPQSQAALHVGWFFVQNLELTAIGGVQFTDGAGHGITTGTLLVEPSVHLPFAAEVDGFAGLGGGVGLSSNGVGFALQQRVGVDVILGPPGTLSASLDLLYATSRAPTTALGGALGYGLTW